MRRRTLTALGAAGLLVALLVSAPASLLDARLNHASDGQWRLAEARGSLWSGAGRLELRDGAGRSTWFTPLSWRLQAATLWRAGLAYELQTGDQAHPFAVLVSPSQLQASAFELDLPASALAGVAPAVQALALGGTIQLRVSSLHLGRGAPRGQASLQWRDAASALAPLSPLGDYDLRMDVDESGYRVALATLRGPLQLDGQGAWAHGEPPRFAATARIAPELQPTLAPFLRLVAVEQADGSFQRAYVR